VRRELEQYDVQLAHRPEVLAMTKAELPDAALARDIMAGDLEVDVLAISAVTGQGLDRLLRAVAQRLDEQRPASSVGRPGA
jgi:GTPase involved in cell partitioning and DNA repair